MNSELLARIWTEADKLKEINPYKATEKYLEGLKIYPTCYRAMNQLSKLYSWGLSPTTSSNVDFEFSSKFGSKL